MNITEHLLACLAEECGEVAKECMKSLRFGLDDQVTLDPSGPRGTEGPTNREKIVEELNDLMAVVKQLVAQGIIPEDWQDARREERKQERVFRYMQYAHRVGALDPGFHRVEGGGQ